MYQILHDPLGLSNHHSLVAVVYGVTLEDAFENTNNHRRAWTRYATTEYTAGQKGMRSTMVGDILIDLHAMPHRAYMVENQGFKEVPIPILSRG